MKKYTWIVNGKEVSEFEAMMSEHYTCVEWVMGRNGWDYNGSYEDYTPKHYK